MTANTNALYYLPYLPPYWLFLRHKHEETKLSQRYITYTSKSFRVITIAMLMLWDF